MKQAGFPGGIDDGLLGRRREELHIESERDRRTGNFTSRRAAGNRLHEEADTGADGVGMPTAGAILTLLAATGTAGAQIARVAGPRQHFMMTRIQTTMPVIVGGRVMMIIGIVVVMIVRSRGRSIPTVLMRSPRVLKPMQPQGHRRKIHNTGHKKDQQEEQCGRASHNAD